MPRQHKDWLEAFCDYASFGEAPRRMYFWTGVSAVAGALRRRVWIDQAYFKWWPNFYIILVAPPGIVSKSTTADVALSLLRQVPEIKFGPSVVTWQALVQSFATSGESFMWGETGTQLEMMSALTIVSSEFGNLLNPQDRDMVDMLVNLWDGKGFQKHTKSSGTDNVINPWLNIIACTTPEWIAGSFPEYMIGGGFTSRCLFVYADAKDKYVAYPAETVPKDHKAKELSLIHDLEWISQKLAGPYKLTPEAIAWGTAWYAHHYKVDAARFDSSRFGGYVARKQTHIHKLAMVLAASCRDELFITAEDLETAHTMVTDLEREAPKVFERIGMKEEARNIQGLLRYISTKGGQVPFADAYRYLQTFFPFKRDLDSALETLYSSGQIRLTSVPGKGYVLSLQGAVEETPPAAPAPAPDGSIQIEQSDDGDPGPTSV